MNQPNLFCAVCNTLILKEAVVVFGKYFHKEHFKCGHCHKELHEKAFYEKNGIAYCEDDFQNIILPKCWKCGDAVRDGVTAMGKNFHKEHFQCGYCDEVIISKQIFFESNGIPYCEADYKTYILPKCAYCKGAVVDGIKALGKIFHKEHFQCGQCHQLLEKNFFEMGGIPYCELDYGQLVLPKCAYCNGSIRDGIAASGKNFHKEHFLCSLCQNQLNERFFEKDGMFYCEADYRNVFKP